MRIIVFVHPFVLINNFVCTSRYGIVQMFLKFALKFPILSSQISF